MKLALRIRQAVRKMFTRTKTVLRIRPRKCTTTFSTMNEPSQGKLPLDAIVETKYLDVMYPAEDEARLDEFFEWASVPMMFLDLFFQQAQYPTAPEYGLDEFFERAQFPRAEEYSLDVFFHLAQFPAAPRYELGSFFHQAQFPEAPQYELYAFYHQAQFLAAPQYELDAFYHQAQFLAAPQLGLDIFFDQSALFQYSQKKVTLTDSVKYHLDEFLRKAYFIEAKFYNLSRFCRLAASKPVPLYQRDESFESMQFKFADEELKVKPNEPKPIQWEGGARIKRSASCSFEHECSSTLKKRCLSTSAL